VGGGGCRGGGGDKNSVKSVSMNTCTYMIGARYMRSYIFYPCMYLD
jgi:hypothetical protein